MITATSLHTYIECDLCGQTDDFGYGAGDVDQAVDAWCNVGGVASADLLRHLCPGCADVARSWAGAV